MSRLDRTVVRNAEELYEEIFRKRGVKFIDHYSTPNMHHPTAKQVSNVELVSHIWKVGDRFFKLAHEHYGDSKLWWVIAWFNQLPTDSHVELGQVINIPVPLGDALGILRTL